MDRAWNSSRYPPKPMVTSCQVKITRGYEFRKVKLKILVLGGVIHAVAIFFHGERKNGSKIRFKRPKWDRTLKTGYH